MKTIELGKNYKATTRYFIGSNGSIEQQTTVYDAKTGTLVQTVFQTKHCKVKVTKGGLLVHYKFNRRRMRPREISQAMKSEMPVINAFINSTVGLFTIENAEMDLYENDPRYRQALLEGLRQAA